MNDFHSLALELKQLRKENNMTQKDLAVRLGVGQTAIANYETGKRFPDEEILVRMADTFDVSIDRLLGRTGEPDLPRKKEPEKFNYIPSDLMQRRDEFMDKALNSSAKANELILNLLNKGYTEEQILIDLLEPALVEAGTRWSEGRYNEAMEHQLSMTALQAMLLIQAGTTAPRNRGKAVFLTATGENHNIGLKMLSRFLEMDGWECYYLGSSVPAMTLQEYIKSSYINLVCISVTLNDNIDSVCAFAEAMKKLETPPFIMAGGSAATGNREQLFAAGIDYIHQTIDITIETAREIKSRKIKN